jgi:uncharacterized membrane protein YidH (DUF202 family)
MPDVLAPIVKQFTDSFSSVLIFVFIFTIFYAMLRKSKMLGESALMNGVTAFVIAFMVTWFSVTYMSLATPLSVFFAQGTALLMFVIFGIIAASVFYPDLPKVLGEFKTRSILWIMIIFGILLFVTSGLISVFWAQASQPPKPGEVRPSTDVIVVSAVILIFVVVLTVAAAAGGSKGGE